MDREELTRLPVSLFNPNKSKEHLNRITVSLACTRCDARNYRTTRKPTQRSLELKKFCPGCKRHTIHKETK